MWLPLTFMDIRPALRTYIVFAALGSIPLLVQLAVIGHHRIDVPLLACNVGLLLLLLAWVFAHRLVLRDGIVRYRTLFRGVTVVPVSSISDVSLRIGVFSYIDRFRPTVRIEVRWVDTSTRLLVINARVFKRKEVDRLLDVIGLPLEPAEKVNPERTAPDSSLRA